MAQITYTFGPDNTHLGPGTFTVTTGDVAQSYVIENQTVLGYAIADLGDTFNGGNTTNLSGIADADDATVAADIRGTQTQVTGLNVTVNSAFGATGATGEVGATGASGAAGEAGATGPVPCYVTGTRILTPRGDVAVEDLAVGDLVVTAGGQARPIRWIGTRTQDCRAHPKPGAVLPVRIAAGALGPNRPARDLRVSPRHGLCLDLVGEVLVPADALINDATITQEVVESVTYWHLELDSHDLFLAEGQPSESYLEIGNRRFFDGAPDALPDGKDLSRADCCRPFVDGDSEMVAFARARARERAAALGWTLRADPVAGLHAWVDGQVLRPAVTGTVVRFLLPAGSGDVRLVSGTSVPEHVGGTGGRRRLGVDVKSVTIDDGLCLRRTVPLDDPRLGAGFHRAEGAEGKRHRWTNGDALLPASLWAGCTEAFFLRLELGGEGLLRWQPPEDVTEAV